MLWWGRAARPGCRLQPCDRHRRRAGLRPGSGLGAAGAGAALALRAALALHAAWARRAAGAGGLCGGLLAAAGAAGAGTRDAVAGDLLSGIHGGVPSGWIEDGLSSMAALSALLRRADSPMRRTVGRRAGAVSPIDRVVAPSPRAGPSRRARCAGRRRSPFEHGYGPLPDRFRRLGACRCPRRSAPPTVHLSEHLSRSQNQEHRHGRGVRTGSGTGRPGAAAR